ncbi:MAG: arylsulfatase [Puniceicoccaceae bacterium]
MKKVKVILLSMLAMFTMGIASIQADRPNIVLIMADDLGWKELGCYGQEKIETPHIDQLAAEGMKFMQFYAGSAVCAPTRCNLMTGMHGGNAYIRNNGEIKTDDPERFGGQTPIPGSIPTIAKTLKKAGYKTGAFGKWGLGAQGSTGDPLRQGFDHFYGYNCQRNAHNLYPKYLEDDDSIHILEGNDRSQTGEQYAPQLIADRMLDFVRDNKDKPFFLYFPTVIPHLPLQAPDEALARYAGRWPETPYTGKSYQPHETPYACYAAMISFMDDQVGRLMNLLEELDLADDTFILFTSDNGTTHLKAQVDYDFFDSVGPLRGLKGQLYEGGIRVPLVARWQGKIKPGTVSNHLSAHYDIPATLAEVAGTKFDPQSDGISFLPVLTGNRSGQERHEFLMWDFAGYTGQLAVRMGKWKGIKRGLVKNPDAPMELYDLKADISESKDLAAEHPAIVKKIQAIIDRERTVPELEKFRFGNYASAN